MRDIRDKGDLAQLLHATQGFILNARADGPRLHKAGCDAVGAMHAGAYPKIFFETYGEAVKALDEKYGEYGWNRCGVCNPYSD